MNIYEGSESYRRRNPHIFGPKISCDMPKIAEKTETRIRQDKPLNKLESELYAILVREFASCTVRPHGVTLRLGSGLRYTPDFLITTRQGFIAVECKGPHAFEDSIVKLKAAASIWPEISFQLRWKNDQKQWQSQSVLP